MTEEQQPQEEERKIKSEGYRPCGCYATEYEDGTVSVKPCPAHGLMETANLMIRAAQMLGTVGQSLLEAHQQQMAAMEAQEAIAKAAESAAQPKEAGSGKIIDPQGMFKKS